MTDMEEAVAWVLQMPNVEQAPHFNNFAFKVNKRIFATLNVDEQHFTIRLPAELQAESINDLDVQPVASKWANQGWTHLKLKYIGTAKFKILMTEAYTFVASPKKTKK